MEERRIISGRNGSKPREILVSNGELEDWYNKEVLSTNKDKQGGWLVAKLKVGVINLGCDKNRIDSEIIIGSLSERYDMTNDPKLADIIVVNTCGFIESSKQESIDTILENVKVQGKV